MNRKEAAGSCLPLRFMSYILFPSSQYLVRRDDVRDAADIGHKLPMVHLSVLPGMERDHRRILRCIRLAGAGDLQLVDGQLLSLLNSLRYDEIASILHLLVFVNL